MDDLVAVKQVERSWGSLEGLAYLLMVERPELLDAGPEVVAGELGLDQRVVVWLLRSSREFRVLLDSFAAAGVWSLPERREAYRVLLDRVKSGEERLGESVRAMEYLDSKVGLQRGTVSSPQVNVRVVQEGDGSWESDYEGLEFGGKGESGRDQRDVVDVEFE